MVYMAASGDATCRGIRSPKDGPMVLEMTRGELPYIALQRLPPGSSADNFNMAEHGFAKACLRAFLQHCIVSFMISPKRLNVADLFLLIVFNSIKYV